jgi:Bacterial protein of unknown function (DUF853)
MKNPAAAAILNIAFRIADDEQLRVLDLKDFRAILEYVAQCGAILYTAFQKLADHHNFARWGLNALSAALDKAEAHAAAGLIHGCHLICSRFPVRCRLQQIKPRTGSADAARPRRRGD